MNILIPHNWLKKYLKTNLSPSRIQELLSLSGPSVEKIEQIENEPVYDIEITTNRVDCMSVYGLAREALPIIQQANIKVSLEKLTFKPLLKTKENIKLPKITIQTNEINRILAIVLDNLNTKKTPEFIVKRLKQIGQNEHNAIIDITNYITHEFGHPCHCFDYDKIMNLGGEIIIKLAEAKMKFTTLDGKTYQTKGKEIIFVNPKGEIIDLPGIKGTLNTAVDDHTKRILFWIENIKPEKIRFASMSHGIRTQAALLNEKNLDPFSARETFLAGIDLYREICQAKIVSSIFNYFPRKGDFTSKTIEINIKKINQYLGVNLSKKKIIKILQNLFFTIQKTKKNSFIKIIPPNYRHDLNLEVDVIEEIARIYGYQNLPSNLNFETIALPQQKGVDFKLENKVKHFLANRGLFECYTYSAIDAKKAKQINQIENYFKISNPLTDDKIYLRQSLIPSLIEVFENQNPNKKSLGLFEMANIYLPELKKINEELHLTILTNYSYRLLKGILESLLNLFYLNYHLENQNINSQFFQQKSWIKIQDQQIGNIFIINQYLTGFDLNIQPIVNLQKKYPQLIKIPQTNPIIEDLTFTIINQPVGPIIQSIKQESKLINLVTLKDIYQFNFTFTIYYLDQEKNLANQDIEILRKQIVNKLAMKFKAKLVGKL